MTDHPRFQLLNAGHDERHRHYHGARAVDFVLGLSDWWLRPPQRKAGRRIAPLHASVPARLSALTATQFVKQLSRGLALDQRRPNGEQT